MHDRVKSLWYSLVQRVVKSKVDIALAFSILLRFPILFVSGLKFLVTRNFLKENKLWLAIKTFSLLEISLMALHTNFNKTLCCTALVWQCTNYWIFFFFFFFNNYNYSKQFNIFNQDLTLSCKMMKNGQTFFKILWCEHRKIFKVCLAFFQHWP